MKRFLLFSLLPALLGLYSRSHGQNISGTINTYTTVTAVAGATVTVGSAAGFVAGDRVLIIQMKGATVTATNTATFGQITAYNNAGNYEFGTIASVAGNQVTLTAPLAQTYTTTGAVQLVRVPVYNNAVINGTLTCTPWNGTIGGVLAFESLCDVTFNANIDVNGRGFRGGGVANSFFNCNDPNYANSFTANASGQKGESIAAYPPNMDGNRAPIASGGGGSNQGNPGAGGGGNGGAGGRGGNEFDGCATTSFGIGGYALTVVSTKAFMGGGGGGGYRDNGLTASTGSNGGGIVFIKTPQIAGNNFQLNANANNVTVVTDSEGAGGGGAGGSVYIWTNTFTSMLNINARGGNGGNINSTLWSGGAHGPGGGGGGGRIWFSTGGVPANTNNSVVAGNAGIIMHPGAYFNTSYGAASGNIGVLQSSLPNVSPLPPATVSIMNDTTICPEDDLLLDPGAGYASYLWQNGSTAQTYLATDSGTYWVEVPACGNMVRDTVHIAYHSPSVNIGPDLAVCDYDSALFDAGAGNQSYLWNSGQTSSSIYASTAGLVIVEIEDANSCYATDTAVLTVYASPVVDLGNDTSLCPGFDITFDAGVGFVSYQWQDMSMNQTYLANTAGLYSVLVTDTNNCVGGDQVQLSYYQLTPPNLGADQSFCSGDSVILNPGTYAGYNWWNGATLTTASVDAVGWYWVDVTDNNGCVQRDSMQVITVYNNPVVNLGADTSFCSGQSLTMDAGSGYTNYLWQNGSSAQTFTTGSAGAYSVTVTDANSCTGTDALQVLTIFPLPAFSLGLDFGLCRGDQFLLEPAGPTVPVSYLWRDDSNNSTLLVNDTGLVWLTVTDVNGCSFRDTVWIFPDCPPTLFIPNSFSPNQDPFNPLFQAYGTNIRHFKMEIYNRWGQHIKTLNGLNATWDGTDGALPLPQGVYVYKVWYMDMESEDVKSLMGHINLLR